MDADQAKALVGFVALPLVGIALIVAGIGGENERLYTILGIAVILIAVVYAASISRVRARAWRDWFPF